MGASYTQRQRLSAALDPSQEQVVIRSQAPRPSLRGPAGALAPFSLPAVQPGMEQYPGEPAVHAAAQGTGCVTHSPCLLIIPLSSAWLLAQPAAPGGKRAHLTPYSPVPSSSGTFICPCGCICSVQSPCPACHPTLVFPRVWSALFHPVP